jgi:hypothetical protein
VARETVRAAWPLPRKAAAMVSATWRVLPVWEK